MKNKRLHQFAVNLMMLILLLGFGYSLYLNLRYQEMAGSESLEKTAFYLEGYDLGLQLNGKFITWPSLKAINREENLDQVPGEMGLVLYLDEQGCSVCADEQTAFVRDLAQRDVNVRVVVHASHFAYARGYLRVNGLGQIPVFYDKEKTFARANRLGHTPTLLLYNERGEVIAGHVPSTSIEEMTRIFHQAVHRYAREHLPNYYEPDGHGGGSH